MDWLDITQIILLLSACTACFQWGKYSGITGTVDFLLNKNLITEEDLKKLGD